MRDFTQMNDLADEFGTDLAILGIPTNQFGHQTNEKDFEIMNVLKYARPGDGYEPKFQLFTKMDANGDNEADFFTYLKQALPTVCDDNAGRGHDYIMAPSNTSVWIWSPMRRSDITWNFEKFLINQEGIPVRRYSPRFETKDVAPDIAKLIKEGPNALNE